MTYAEREAIFAKDYLTIADLCALLGLTYQMAAKRMRDIKRKTDRLGIQGKIHVQDYLDYFEVPAVRYRKAWEGEGSEEDRKLRSVCTYSRERRYG